VELDQRPRPFVAGLPRTGGGILDLSGLVEQLGNLLFVTQQQLADGTPNLLSLTGITPQNMF
jgi:hypothetical protein